MFTDPLAVTYDGSTLQLPRVGSGNRGTAYRTADGVLEMRITSITRPKVGNATRYVKLTRRLPDPTPGDAFDAFRVIEDSFGVSYDFDLSRGGLLDIPKLRTALLSFLDSAIEARILNGEQ
jgi:hypothetical protein